MSEVVGVSLNNGESTIVRRGIEFEIRCRHLDRDFTMPLPNIANNGNFLNCIKFIVECIGFNYVSSGFKIEANVNDFQHFKNNATLLIGVTKIGPLILKKIRALPCCNDTLFKNEFRILAKLQGVLKLKNDVNGHRYGVILERCYKPNINFCSFITAIDDLNTLHASSEHLLHGDVNPNNIMSDCDGYLKLVDPVCLLENQVNMVNMDYDDLTQDSEKNVFLNSLIILVERKMLVDSSEIYINLDDRNPEFNLTRGFRLSELRSTISAIDINSWKSLNNFKPEVPDHACLKELQYYKIDDAHDPITDGLDDEDVI